jgi:sugar O-acyltransferase (sialic acid O-acetyltransferase NeuD family)
VSTNRPLLLLGGGGHAAVVAECARAAGFELFGCLDDDPTVAEALRTIDVDWRGEIGDLMRLRATLPTDLTVHAAVGSNVLRRDWLAGLRRDGGDLEVATIVHPTAVVSPSATLSAGAFLAPGAIVNARAAIGPGVIINSGAIVEHDCVIGAYTHVTPGAVLGGAVEVGDGAMIGLGAVLLPGVRVGEEAKIGAGAVVTGDIPGRVTAIGVPAKVVVPAIS